MSDNDEFLHTYKHMALIKHYQYSVLVSDLKILLNPCINRVCFVLNVLVFYVYCFELDYLRYGFFGELWCCGCILDIQRMGFDVVDVS